MPTSFDEIHDLALLSFRDWQLDSLYQVDPNEFKTLLDGYLIKGIPSFTNCNSDLSYTLSSRQFNNNITLSEKVILSKLEVIVWMDGQIQNTTEMNLHLNDTDFRMYSEAQNLTAKVNARVNLKEEVSQDMVDYGLKNAPWLAWSEGNFFGT